MLGVEGLFGAGRPRPEERRQMRAVQLPGGPRRVHLVEAARQTGMAQPPAGLGDREPLLRRQPGSGGLGAVGPPGALPIPLGQHPRLSCFHGAAQGLGAHDQPGQLLVAQPVELHSPEGGQCLASLGEERRCVGGVA